MALFELFVFLISFYLLFFSCVGHGFLFSKILKFNDQYSSIGLYGIFGIVALTFYSYLTILIIPHNVYSSNSLKSESGGEPISIQRIV